MKGASLEQPGRGVNKDKVVILNPREIEVIHQALKEYAETNSKCSNAKKVFQDFSALPIYSD